MTYINIVRRLRRAAVSFTFVLLIFAAPAAAEHPSSQTHGIVGGNSANGSLFSLHFDHTPPIAETINDDANTRVSLRSFNFFKNTCGPSVDIVAADTNRNEIVIYPQGSATHVVECPAGANCPSRPDGISSSNERLMAVAQTATAGGIPGIWLFQPAECGTGKAFDPPRFGGQFRIHSGGVATFVADIADTEFVRAPGANLDAGDLIVLTRQPATIARVKAADIEALLNSLPGSGAMLPAADILVDESFFGSASPTGIAFVPGTAGVGLVGTNSESEDLLVTFAGQVVALTFQAEGEATVLANSQVLVDGLGNSTLGVAAGTLDDLTLMVVADRQRGRFDQYELNITAGKLPSKAEIPPPLSIVSGVQNPYGVAIDSDSFDASLCSRETGGCQIRKTVKVLFTQELQGDDNTVFATFYILTDPRGTSGGTINLHDEVSSEFDVDLEIPASCRGFPLTDEDPPKDVLVVMDMATNFAISAGEFIQLKETVDELFPELGPCGDTGARLYYHQDPKDPPSVPKWLEPAPEQGVLYDTTFYCSNPSRSITPTFSTVALCQDRTYLEIKDSTSKNKLSGKVGKTVQQELMMRLNNLSPFIDALPAALNTLKTDLRNRLNEAMAIASNPKKNITDAWDPLDQGAEKVFLSKGPIATHTAGTELSTLYANLLLRYLASAFYACETTTGGERKYGPSELLTEGSPPELTIPGVLSPGCFAR